MDPISSDSGSTFLVGASDPAEAVQQFFQQFTAVKDREAPTKPNQVLKDRLVQRITAGIANRLCHFGMGLPFGRCEEISFEFSRDDGHYKLVSPAPVTGDLKYCFRSVDVYLDAGSTDELSKTDDHDSIFLRVTPTLITLGGYIVWQESP